MAETVFAADNIIIAQVLYDPANSESGGEAVELYNPAPEGVDISGWTISTETSAADAVLPQGTIIRSGGYYLVADAGWSAVKDAASWPEADYEEALTLANTDAGVALSDGSGVIDAVGWGNAANIVAGLYEGNPHSGSGSGESLARVKNGSIYADTNNNAADFTASLPSFRNSSHGTSHGSGEIAVVAIVEGSFPLIHSIKIITDDDSFAGGNQVNPEPKRNKTVEVSAVISHGNGNDYLNAVTLNFGGSLTEMTPTPLNSTASVYTGGFNVSYYVASGNYTITVTATDKGGLIANVSAVFEYTSLMAMELDTPSLRFAAMPGTTSEIGGDYDAGTSANTTITNVGNSVMDLQLSGTNLSSGGSAIDVSRIQYTFNGDYSSSLAGTLSHEKQAKQVSIGAASKQPLSFRLNVPTATAPGNYTGTITLVAVKP